VQSATQHSKRSAARLLVSALALAAAAGCSSRGSAVKAGPSQTLGKPVSAMLPDASRSNADAPASAAGATPGPQNSPPPTEAPDASVAKPSRARDAGNRSDSDAGDIPAPKRCPILGGHVAGPVTGGNGPDAMNPVDLHEHGYVEQELLLDGDATAYAAKGDLGIDGAWNAVPNGHARYQTRLLVRRPADAKNFNGTVLVEWLNVTGGIDAAVGYAFAWEELLRGGYGYVGVSVQQAGVDSLKSGDAARYGSLDHPGDEYSYDIFAQAGAAIGCPGQVDPMQGLHVERLIAYGESQSAMRMITYVNAVQPLTPVFDGIIIHSRAGWGAPIGTEGDPLIGNGNPVHVRGDIEARVLQFFTESELFLSLGPAFAARQPDTERLRTWEVAGAAHADQHLLGKGADLGCGLVNDGPQHLVLKAAVRAMHLWLKDGVAPPMGEPLEVNATHDAIVRDKHGNALGGIRTPAVDTPIATISGEASSANAGNPLCMLFGQTIPFARQQLLDLYPAHQDYVEQVTRSARATREAGFILPEEETTVVADAMAAPIPQ
jgi:hypothetical protein